MFARVTERPALALATMLIFASWHTPTAETRSTVISVPVNNIVDNFSLTKGKHNMQFGVNWRLVHQNRTSDENSYNNASHQPLLVEG